MIHCTLLEVKQCTVTVENYTIPSFHQYYLQVDVSDIPGMYV